MMPLWGLIMKVKCIIGNNKYFLRQGLVAILLYLLFSIDLLYSQEFILWDKVQRANKITGHSTLEDGSTVRVTVSVSSNSGQYYPGVDKGLVEENIISTIEGKLANPEVKYKQGFVYPQTYEEAKLTKFNQMFEVKKSPRSLPTILTFEFSHPVQIKEFFIGDLDAIQKRYLGCGTERLYYINSHDESFFLQKIDFHRIYQGEMLEDDFKPRVSTNSLIFKKPSKIQVDRNGYDYAVFVGGKKQVKYFQMIFTGWDDFLPECGDNGYVGRSNALNYFAMKVGYFQDTCGSPPPQAEELQTICVRKQPVIANLEAQGKQLRWYTRITGGKQLEQGYKLSDGQKYFVSQTISGCESERVGVRVAFHYPTTDKSIKGRNILCVGQGTQYSLKGENNGRWLSSDKEMLQIDSKGKAVGLKAGEVLVNYMTPIQDKWCDSMLISKNVRIFPLPFDVEAQIVIQPLCDKEKGAITIVPQEGVLYSLDGKNWQEDNKFVELPEGEYSLYVKSKITECVVESFEKIRINKAPLPLNVPTLNPVTGDNVISKDEIDEGILLSGDIVDNGDIFIHWGNLQKKATIKGNFWECLFSKEEIPDFKNSIITIELKREKCSNTSSYTVLYPDANSEYRILAEDDKFEENLVSFHQGNQFIGSILVNDLLNDQAVSSEDVILEIIEIKLDGLPIKIEDSGVQITAKGRVNISPQSKKGLYEIKYSICDKFVPLVCDDALVTIMIKANCNRIFKDMKIPQFLSINKDGYNEMWKINELLLYQQKCGSVHNKIYIFDKLGRIVYEKKDYMLDEERFCGHSNVSVQEDLSVGTYFYLIKLETGNIRTGFITIFNENDEYITSSF